MEITLKQNEIEKGIVAYLDDQGINTENTTVTITLIAGRKGSGHSAKVEINAEEPKKVPYIDDESLIDEPITDDESQPEESVFA